MQVVVLAGGFGTRLRPWTAHLPKPLLPMLDKTLLERVLDLIPAAGVDKVVVAAGYGIEQMQAHFSGLDLPFELVIQPEYEPLGTGGAIANCAEHLEGTFVVINGDLITSLDITSIVEAHRAFGGLATISLWEVEDPTRFGVAETDSASRILRFREKPPAEEVFSNMINAGTYVLEPEVLDLLPAGPHSIERDVYTGMAAEGTLFGFGFEGYFVDAGTPESWLESCRTCLMAGRWDRGAIDRDSWIDDAVDTGRATLDSAFISRGCDLCDAQISDSCLLENVSMGSGSKLSGCLIGSGASIGAGVELAAVIVDFGASVPDGWKQAGGTYESSEHPLE